MSDLIGKYTPKALYYEDADSLEYVREDCPQVHRRIDDFLTLILRMDSRKPIGFKIKGFKNFYLKSIRPKYGPSRLEFLRLKVVLEDVMTELGNEIFADSPKNEAYRIASEIAETDQVILSDLPDAA